MTTRRSRQKPGKAMPTNLPPAAVPRVVDNPRYDDRLDHAALMARIADPALLRASTVSPVQTGSASSASVNATDQPCLFTVDEVASALRVSTKTVRRRIAAGLIRTADLGGRLVRIPAAELRRLLGSARDGNR